MSLSGWIGPEYTTTKNLVPIFCTPYGCFIEVFHNRSVDHGAYGGNFDWTGQRNAATLGFSRMPSPTVAFVWESRSYSGYRQLYPAT